MSIRLSGIASGLDTDAIVKQLTSGQVAKKDNIWKAKESLKYTQEAWQEMNKEIYSYFTDTLSKARLQATYDKSELSVSDDKIAAVTGGKVHGTQTLNVKQVASQTFLTGTEVEQTEPAGVKSELTVKIGGREETLNITPDMSMKQVAKKLCDVGLIANFDERTKRLFIASKSTGANSNFEICGDASSLDALGLGAAAAKQNGKDAIIELNGAEFKSESNNFKVNDLSISAQAEGTVTFGQKKTSDIYTTIKEFVEGYNALIKKINAAYNNSSSKGYNPLTDDEKEALSDRQIEEWEKKLKEGALSKNVDLDKVRNILSTGMMFRYNKKSLSSFGISMGSYFSVSKEDRGTYQIDEKKLKTVIEENPQEVVDFMTNLAENLYTKLNDKMRSSSMNSVYNVYNDKKIKKDIADYEKKIKQWEDKIAATEDKYYKQFAAMEKMLSQIQSQNTSLSNLFGIK